VHLFKQDALPRLQLVRQMQQQQQQQQGQDDASADAQVAALQRVMDNCLLLRVMAVSGQGPTLGWAGQQGEDPSPHATCLHTLLQQQ
jgi:hypothetical protein